jgi:hypothetical protein
MMVRLSFITALCNVNDSLENVKALCCKNPVFNHVKHNRFVEQAAGWLDNRI